MVRRDDDGSPENPWSRCDDPAAMEDEPRSSSSPEGVDDGIDVTVIRWMLSLTPLERLAILQGFVDSVFELTNGPRRS